MGWEFNHVPMTQPAFLKWATKEACSPIVELAQWSGGTGSVREQAGRKLRKLEREMGEVDFEFDCRDRDVFNACLSWKKEQYKRTGMYDIFASRNGRWLKDSLSRLFDVREEELSGRLSVLRVNGTPAAAHFGMRSRTDFHYWFPSYDVAVGSYSPGILLLMKITDATAAAGMNRLDLGRGDARYKSQVATDMLPLVEGCVVVQPLAHGLLQARKGARQMARALKRRLKGEGEKAKTAPAEASP
jgi:CelD/BcsL family acetyltransferase involved in cellulose biosynthesis